MKGDLFFSWHAYLNRKNRENIFIIWSATTIPLRPNRKKSPLALSNSCLILRSINYMVYVGNSLFFNTWGFLLVFCCFLNMYHSSRILNVCRTCITLWFWYIIITLKDIGRDLSILSLYKHIHLSQNDCSYTDFKTEFKKKLSNIQ